MRSNWAQSPSTCFEKLALAEIGHNRLGANNDISINNDVLDLIALAYEEYLEKLQVRLTKKDLVFSDALAYEEYLEKLQMRLTKKDLVFSELRQRIRPKIKRIVDVDTKNSLQDILGTAKSR